MSGMAGGGRDQNQDQNPNFVSDISHAKAACKSGKKVCAGAVPCVTPAPVPRAPILCRRCFSCGGPAPWSSCTNPHLSAPQAAAHSSARIARAAFILRCGRQEAGWEEGEGLQGCCRRGPGLVQAARLPSAPSSAPPNFAPRSRPLQAHDEGIGRAICKRLGAWPIWPLATALGRRDAVLPAMLGHGQPRTAAHGACCLLNPHRMLLWIARCTGCLQSKACRSPHLGRASEAAAANRPEACRRRGAAMSITG